MKLRYVEASACFLFNMIKKYKTRTWDINPFLSFLSLCKVFGLVDNRNRSFIHRGHTFLLHPIWNATLICSCCLAFWPAVHHIGALTVKRSYASQLELISVSKSTDFHAHFLSIVPKIAGFWSQSCGWRRRKKDAFNTGNSVLSESINKSFFPYIWTLSWTQTALFDF